MEIIAKTEHGFIISASENEVREIIHSVTGNSAPKEIPIGQKLPAIDYAQSIKKLKELKDDYTYKQLKSYLSNLYSEFVKFSGAVENAASIEI